MTASADGHAEGFYLLRTCLGESWRENWQCHKAAWSKLLLLDTCCFLVGAEGAVQVGAARQHPVSAARGALSPLLGQGAAGCLCDMALSVARPVTSFLGQRHKHWLGQVLLFPSLPYFVCTLHWWLYDPVSCEKWCLSRELSTDFQGTVFLSYIFFFLIRFGLFPVKNSFRRKVLRPSHPWCQRLPAHG